MQPFIESQEYSNGNFCIDKDWSEYSEELQRFDKNIDYLSLYKEFDYEQNKLVVRPYYFIGYRWLDDKNYIHVSPKIYKGKQADCLSMFLTCLQDPIVSKQLDETYKIFFNEKWIDIEDTKDEITPFLIADCK